MSGEAMQGGQGGVAVATGERVVKVAGSASHLLDGDPDQENPRYSGQALPMLLHEGWRVKLGIPFSGGVYLVLEGQPTPAARMPAGAAAQVPADGGAPQPLGTPVR